MFDDEEAIAFLDMLEYYKRIQCKAFTTIKAFVKCPSSLFADVLNLKTMAKPEISNFECQPCCHTARCSTRKVPEVSQQLQKMNL